MDLWQGDRCLAAIFVALSSFRWFIRAYWGVCFSTEWNHLSHRLTESYKVGVKKDMVGVWNKHDLKARFYLRLMFDKSIVPCYSLHLLSINSAWNKRVITWMGPKSVSRQQRITGFNRYGFELGAVCFSTCTRSGFKIPIHKQCGCKQTINPNIVFKKLTNGKHVSVAFQSMAKFFYVNVAVYFAKLPWSNNELQIEKKKNSEFWFPSCPLLLAILNPANPPKGWLCDFINSDLV